MSFTDPQDATFYNSEVLESEPQYSCRSCGGKNFTRIQMKKEPYMDYNRRGICKKCISEYSSYQLLKARAEKTPEKYNACRDCDRVFSKHPVGAPSKLGRVRNACPYCSSKNIEDY